MPKTKTAAALLGVMAALLLIFFLAFRWSSRPFKADRADLLSLMPADANAVGFLDWQQLRGSAFLSQALSWIPQVVPDSDYAQFMQATGFDYDRDLDRVALAFNRQSPTPWIFAVAEGHFDRKKIEAYGARFSSLKTADGKVLFAVPVTGSERKAYFTFLRDDRIAWANDSSCFFERPANGLAQAWREHYERVAGTPIFAVLQQDSGAAAALAQAPGGFRSPQLATLLSQLQWITISAKPDGNFLRVVIDGESASESTVHQLKELLGDLVVLTQMGLNDAKTRKQLDPELRQGYLDLLQTAEIKQLDRGNSKSLRIILEVAPKLLQAPKVPATPPIADPPAPRHKARK